MPDNAHIAVLVLVAAAVTWALRVLPFAVLAPMRHSSLVRFLSLHMPVGVMVMLTIYTLYNRLDASGVHLLWLALASGITVGLHLWRGQALVSILGGTLVYVVLMTAL